ncbi:hypothetical protein BTN50_1070 [Candidatus Enterovibrio altilux]|uniref:Uncharacterized protein n=1 Tax=Candidatus Enterovibrio altilux TaxID=1927128 RepID=A0A291B975_9GAMM|nr:hypothetical protein BTN50_1070 [Candidatus Enterovibrio luxaltus]
MKKLFGYGIKLNKVIMGKPRLFSSLAITTTLMVKCLFSMSLKGQ